MDVGCSVGCECAACRGRRVHPVGNELDDLAEGIDRSRAGCRPGRMGAGQPATDLAPGDDPDDVPLEVIGDETGREIVLAALRRGQVVRRAA